MLELLIMSVKLTLCEKHFSAIIREIREPNLSFNLNLLFFDLISVILQFTALKSRLSSMKVDVYGSTTNPSLRRYTFYCLGTVIANFLCEIFPKTKKKKKKKKFLNFEYIYLTFKNTFSFEHYNMFSPALCKVQDSQHSSENLIPSAFLILSVFTTQWVEFQCQMVIEYYWAWLDILMPPQLKVS